MREGWKRVALSEIATDMYRGSGIKREQITPTGTPCVRYGEIYTTYNYFFDKCVSHTDASQIAPKKYFEKGDLLFVITGESVEEIGKTVAYLGDEKCLAGGDLVVMKHNQNPKYLSYALSTPDAIRQKGLGKTKLKVVHTNIPSLKTIEIPISSLSEQQRIVEMLDAEFAKIDAIKANAEKQLQWAKDLFQSALKDLLTPKEGWERKTLKEITSKIGSGATPKGGKSVYIEEGCSLIRSLNVLNGRFKYDDLAHITESAATALNGVTIEPNDILFNITGASIARSCIVPTDVLPARVNQHVSIIRLKDDNILPLFVCYLLLCEHHQKVLLAIGESGSTRQALTKNDLENHVVEIPKLEEQQMIIEKIESLSEKVKQLQLNYEKTIALCNDLKQSLLKDIFG